MNRILNATQRKLNAEEASRYPTHCVRMGGRDGTAEPGYGDRRYYEDVGAEFSCVSRLYAIPISWGIRYEGGSSADPESYAL